MTIVPQAPSAAQIRAQFRARSASTRPSAWRDLFGFLGLEPLLARPLSPATLQAFGCHQQPYDLSSLQWGTHFDPWLPLLHRAAWPTPPPVPKALLDLYHPAPPRFLLGRHVEALARFVAQDLLHLEVLAHNLAVSDPDSSEPRRTIGELDLVYRLENQVRHRELAAKWYLYDPIAGARTTLDHCWGPKRRDRLDLKLRRMLTHQLPLGQHPATLRVLPDLAAGVQELWLCGQLFWPLDLAIPERSDPGDGAHLNPQAIAGRWTTFSRWQADNKLHPPDHLWYRLDKRHWLELGHEGSLAALPPDAASQDPWPWPVLLAQGPKNPSTAPWSERARLFVVPDGWRDQARNASAPAGML